MTAWDEMRKAIDAGDLESVVGSIAVLDEADRKAIGRELPGRLRDIRTAAPSGVLPRQSMLPLLLAGAGTIRGAAGAAAWLCRREFRPWWSLDEDAFRTALLTVTAHRPAEWRADVAHRVAARISPSDSWATPLAWLIAATLTRAAGAKPPPADGFVVGWLQSGIKPRPEELADDPFLDALVPRLFDADGVGAALAGTTAGPTWATTLAALAESGRLDRKSLLDGCVSRFLRGGTPQTLRWFVQLHTALAPTDAECAARVRDYVRLLPTAPSTVAETALEAVRRADEIGRLDGPLFEEAASALLFRPEKKLVRAALIWLGKTAAARDRIDATLRAVPAVFTSGSADLQERAAKIVSRYAGRADASTLEEVRERAADLPMDLRAMVGATGTAPDPVLASGPPPFEPRRQPPPIETPEELVREFIAIAYDGVEDGLERFLSALITLAHTDRDATAAALRRIVDDRFPFLLVDKDPYAKLGWGFAQTAVRALLLPRPGRLHSALESIRRGHFWREGPGAPRGLHHLLVARTREIVPAVGTAPLLLATPTAASGHVDAHVLVDRMERLEGAGAEPGPADLLQALLRVPRDIDPDAVKRAQGLTSDAGRRVASWLGSGGLPDPAVECEITDRPLVRLQGRTVRPPSGLLPSVTAPTGVDPGIARLLTLSADDVPGHSGEVARWPALLPSHREVVAAHMLPYAQTLIEDGWTGGIPMLALAEADGPTGAATGTLLAYALADSNPGKRADAADALLVLTARGDLPAAEFGTALGRLAALHRIKLNRVVPSLAAAADAGAHTDMWTAIAAALPHALPAPGDRAPAGLPDLIALGTRTAAATGARTPIPALTGVAARGGVSRLIKEAVRLDHLLTTP